MTVWSDYVEEYTSLQRLVHGAWLSLLRVSAEHGSAVYVETGSSSSTLVESVSLVR